MKNALLLTGILSISLQGCFLVQKRPELVEIPKEEIIVVEKPVEETIEKEEGHDGKKEITYDEKVSFLKNYLIENRKDENNIYRYQIGDEKVYVALPDKKLRGRNDLLYVEIIHENKSILYIHQPEDEYPGAALEGEPGIFDYLLKVYDEGGSLEANILLYYTVHNPPTKEQLTKYEEVINRLEKIINN